MHRKDILSPTNLSSLFSLLSPTNLSPPYMRESKDLRRGTKSAINYLHLLMKNQILVTNN